MKEIMAIIRMNKMNDTKRALVDAGVSALTACKVMGRGKNKVDFFVLQGAQQGAEEAISQLSEGPKFIPKRMLTVVVPDDRAALVVKTISEVNHTGNPGDGKIFVLPVMDAVRVRTSETGDVAIDEASA